MAEKKAVKKAGKKKKGLGRGLDALIKDKVVEKAASPGSEARQGGVLRVKVDEIRANPWQPRNDFDAQALSELVESVRLHGVLQPLLVRKAEDGAYELIAGERRLRAARAALLDEVPVIVIEADDAQSLELALIENLQREDLNPIEEAEGYALLQKKFGLTQEEVAARVGKARASVANALRLLELPDSVRQYVAEGLLSVGHAKVLLSVPDDRERERLARRAIRESLSVRALERIVKRAGQPARKAAAGVSDIPEDYLHTLSDELHHYFGTSVRISPSRTLGNGRKVKGSIEIDFHDNEELDRLLSLMGFSTDL